VRVKSRGWYEKVEGDMKKSRVLKKSKVEICGQNNLFNVVTWTYHIYVCMTTLVIVGLIRHNECEYNNIII
jgi:hypothetical protein